jgi:hypothetical protein
LADTVESVRVELAFAGGPILAANVTPAGADALESALSAGAEGTHVLDTDDGRVAVVLGRVVYVKRFARDAKVGFGLI